MEIITIDDHITAIDHDLFGIPGIGVTFVIQGDDIALIETGTSLTVQNTLAGLDQLNIAREAISHIICTHSHMDHAGGAGYLADALPRAAVYIHTDTMHQLIDPTELMSKFRRVVGAAASANTGDMLPIPPERLRPAETLSLDLGKDVTLEAIPTPGHSPDHICFWEQYSGGLFLGDAASVSLPMYHLAFPKSPTLSYNLTTHRSSIATLQKHDITRLYLTHWGVENDVDSNLRHSLEKLDELENIVEEALRTGNNDIAALAAQWVPYPANGTAALVAQSWSQMSVTGMMNYKKDHQATNT